MVMKDKKLAAAFIDFENFYFSLTNLYEMAHQDAGEVVVALIASQLDKLSNSHGEFVIRQAFADWSSFPGIKKELQRMGIRIIDVLSTAYKNSADIELSLAVLETIITRPEIEVVVIFAGDRDYMPVALRARERGRSLFFVGFEKSLSGDVKSLVGKSSYSYVDLGELSVGRNNDDMVETNTARSTPAVEGLTPDEVKAAMAAIMAFDQYRGRFGCVKVSIFLVEGLPKALPELDHFRRKQIFSALVSKGIIVTEQKKPENFDPELGGYPYTVFSVNENNEAVKKIRNSSGIVSGNAREILLQAALSAAGADGTVLGADLGNALKMLFPAFSPAKYGFSGLAELVDHNLDILQYDGNHSGGDRIYRLVIDRQRNS